MIALFQQLYGMASMTAMDAKIEEQLQHQHTDGDRELLQKIYESNDLDEREALIAQRLGHMEHSLFLFTRVQQKRGRPENTEPFSDFLE